MNKAESKYFNTALRMDEALIKLLEIKDLEFITVKEICQRAGVNRSTFYLHYETVGDLVNEAMDMVDKRFLSYFAQDAKDFSFNVDNKELKDLVLITREYLLPYLRFINENKSIYHASFRNPGSMRANLRYARLKKQILEPILMKFGVPSEFRAYYMAYYIEGIAAIIKEWLRNGCREQVEDIAAVIEECVRPPGGMEGLFYGR